MCDSCEAVRRIGCPLDWLAPTATLPSAIGTISAHPRAIPIPNLLARQFGVGQWGLGRRVVTAGVPAVGIGRLWFGASLSPTELHRPGRGVGRGPGRRRGDRRAAGGGSRRHGQLGQTTATKGSTDQGQSRAARQAQGARPASPGAASSGRAARGSDKPSGAAGAKPSGRRAQVQTPTTPSPILDNAVPDTRRRIRLWSRRIRPDRVRRLTPAQPRSPAARASWPPRPRRLRSRRR